jgi:hypothetical protein
MDFQEKQQLLDLGESFRGSFTCLSSEYGLLAVNGNNGILTVWDLNKGDSIRHFEEQEGTFPVAFIERGKKLVAGNARKDLHYIWDLANGDCVHSWPGASGLFWVDPLVIDPDEQWSLSVGEWGQGSVLKDFRTGRETRLNLETYENCGLDISADGQLLAASSYYGFVRVWDAITYHEIVTLKGFFMAAHAVTFSPYDTRLAAGGDGAEAVKIWATDSWQELITLSGEGSGHHRVKFSAEGNMLGSLNNEGLLHVWRAPSWEEIEAREGKGKTKN